MNVKSFLEQTAHLPETTRVKNSGWTKEYTLSLGTERMESISLSLDGSTYFIDIAWGNTDPERDVTLKEMREMKTGIPFQNASGPGMSETDIKIDVDDRFVYSPLEEIIIADNMVILLAA